MFLAIDIGMRLRIAHMIVKKSDEGTPVDARMAYSTRSKPSTRTQACFEMIEYRNFGRAKELLQA
jgi:hypothetical protein